MSKEFEDEFEFAEDDFFSTPDESEPDKVSNNNKRLNMSGRAGEATSSAVPDPNRRVQKPPSKGKKQNQQHTGQGYMQHGGTSNQLMPDEVQIDSDSDDLAKMKQPKKKKGKALKVFLILVIIAVLAIIGAKFILSNRQAPQQVSYAGSGRELYDSLQSALQNYKAETIDDLVGKDNGDSYLAQEWAYANFNPSREKFILLATSKVKFKYPTVEQKNTKGGTMTDSDGNPVMIESFMNDGEELEVTVLDYQAIGDKIKTDFENIETMMVAKGITKDDYDYQNECIDLLMDYLLKQVELPTTTKKFRLPISNGKFKDDIALDKIIFSSDEFHYMCDEFDKIVTGYKPTETQEYYAEEEVHNDEYDEWYKLFKKYYDSDNGKFSKSTSKWEPWYKRDKNNKFILDKKGHKIVNYYSVKDKNGNDWIQPSKTIFKKVKKTREVPVTYIAEKGVSHCFLGAYYCQNDYTGLVNAEVKVGDGTLEHPAGVNTPVITKVLCRDGQYHDVRVTMKGYWIGEDAITYAGTFSEKNRGFDPRSVVQLICYEIEVENLEKKPITFDSEMVLCDKNSNKSPRTGTMYEFKNEEITVSGKSSTIINDWASSTEINQKYVIWGKSFDRHYSTVYFKVLAGTGDIPTYSAYKAFTGESSMSGSASIPELPTDTPKPTKEPTPTPIPSAEG